MQDYTIMFSNLGYAKGIDGSLWQHLIRFHRHIYCPVPPQITALTQLKSIIDDTKPDLCCFVEIDQGSLTTGGLDQIRNLVDDNYTFYDVMNKYGPDNRIAKLPLHSSKSNGFIAKSAIPYERIYFSYGSKRLLYKIILSNGTHVYFAHFSLQQKVRAKQFEELNTIIRTHNNPVIILADFNIFSGFRELDILLHDTDLVILNDENEPTFTFHRRRLTLDLCLCSRDLVPQIQLNIIPQPFSDHAALLLTMKPE